MSTPYRKRMRRRLFILGDRLTDRACDWPDRRWRWLSDLPFTADERAQRLFCRLLGHHPIPDHCGIPAHDQCAWCRTAMPNEAPRSDRSGEDS